MKITEHALKKLSLLIGQEKALKEVLFMHNFILPGMYSIKWKYGIQLSDVKTFANRCESFNIDILGFETHIESPYPLYEFTYEQYSDHGSSWIQDAINDFTELQIFDFIVPTIDILDTTLNEYL